VQLTPWRCVRVININWYQLLCTKMNYYELIWMHVKFIMNM
jgi:hypothetical protein